MKRDKAPGTSQLTTDMLKYLPNDKLDFVVDAVQEFWQQVTDLTTWLTKLNILHKGKGNLHKNIGFHHVEQNPETPKILWLKITVWNGGMPRDPTHPKKSPLPKRSTQTRNMHPLCQPSERFRHRTAPAPLFKKIWNP